MTASWKAVLGVILIFVFGFVAGIACSSILAHRKTVTFLQHPAEAVAAGLEKRLTKNLDLDENQKQQIHGYFTQNLEQRLGMQKQIQPQVRLINLATFQEVNAVLRPEQQQRFRQNLDETRRRFGRTAITAEDENGATPLGQPALAPNNPGGADK